MSSPSRTVRIVNTGDTGFTAKYDNVRYDIPVGGELFVPWAAACLWLGDPRKKDISPQRRERLNELHRLYSKWGVIDNDPDTFEANRPKLKVYTTDGTEIPMVADDPEGTAVDPFEADRGEGPEERIYALEQALKAVARSGDSALAETLASLGIGDTQGDNSVLTAKPARGQGKTPPVDRPTRPKASV